MLSSQMKLTILSQTVGQAKVMESKHFAAPKNVWCPTRRLRKNSQSADNAKTRM